MKHNFSKTTHTKSSKSFDNLSKIKRKTEISSLLIKKPSNDSNSNNKKNSTTKNKKKNNRKCFLWRK